MNDLNGLDRESGWLVCHGVIALLFFAARSNIVSTGLFSDCAGDSVVERVAAHKIFCLHGDIRVGCSRNAEAAESVSVVGSYGEGDLVARKQGAFLVSENLFQVF